MTYNKFAAIIGGLMIFGMLVATLTG